MNTVRITEIFHSIQGESTLVGLPTVFVRLTGCPLRCHYCDTEYAFTGGEKMTLASVLEQVEGFNCPRVCVTGGEPLSQKGCFELLTQLCDKDYQVSLETSGAFDISEVDPRVIKVMDLKTPASGEMGRNRTDNFSYLGQQDQVKFVICNRKDYDWAKLQMDTYKLTEVAEVLFSPSYEQLEPGQLADWVLEDGLQVRFQIQLHKVLWGDLAGV